MNVDGQTGIGVHPTVKFIIKDWANLTNIHARIEGAMYRDCFRSIAAILAKQKLPTSSSLGIDALQSGARSAGPSEFASALA